MVRLPRYSKLQVINVIALTYHLALIETNHQAEIYGQLQEVSVCREEGG